MTSKLFMLAAGLLFSGLLLSSPILRADGGHDNHTPNYCSADNENVCMHLGHFDKFVSEKPMEFMGHILTPQNAEVQDFKMYLWMPDMGHGSSPVTVTSKGVNKFWISDANFIMSGKWLVRVEFTFENALHKIDIPLDVE